MSEETPAQNETPTGTTPATASGSDTSNQQSNRSNYNTRARTTRPTQVSSFKGSIPEIGAVIGTKTESRTQGSFKMFQEKLVGYIMEKYDHPRDIAPVVRDLEDMDLDKHEPEDPDKNASATKIQIHREKVKRHLNRMEALEDNKMRVYGLVWGQCTAALQAELRGVEDFKEKDSAYNCLWLLQQVKLVSSGVDQSTSNPSANLFLLLKNFYYNKQGPDETVETYAKRFENMSTSIELAGGQVFHHPGLQKLELKRMMEAQGEAVSQATSNDTATAKQTSSEAYKAVIFLECADSNRYMPLWQTLRNDALIGQDNYPRTMTRTYDILTKYKTPNRRRNDEGGRGAGRGGRDENNRASGRSFLQTGDQGGDSGNTRVVTGTDGRRFPDVRCYRCQSNGHYSGNCPGTPSQHLQVGLCLIQASPTSTQHNTVNPDWLLLDSCSTVSSINNGKFLQSIKTCKQGDEMRVYTNGGSQDYDKFGTLKFFPFDVFYNPASMANILALKDVADRFKITMDTTKERAMLVHVSNDTIVRFSECGNGLYYFDTSTIHNLTKNNVTEYSFLSTVKDNKAYFHKREIEGADNARILQQLLNWPSTQKFKEIIASNQLRNCNTTVDDINRAEAIYGPTVAMLKGKTVRKRPEHTQHRTRVPIPAPILSQHREVRLFMDYFFVNGRPFYHTLSDLIDFRTAHECRGRGKMECREHLEEVKNKYESRGFKITSYHGDNEFTHLEDHVRPATTQICAAGEHVPEIERSIRTTKERVRCTIHSMPYKRLPKTMIKHIILDGTFWLNAFASKNGISKTLSPANIVLGTPSPDCKLLKLRTGAYVQLTIGTTNTTKSRTI
jgi:hypothetical protein